MTNWKHSFPGTKNTSNLFICMTDTKQYQLIFENWRRYSSSTISETPIYSYTGSVADPKDPTKVWDPKTVTQTAVTGPEKVGHAQGALEDVFQKEFVKSFGADVLKMVTAHQAAAMAADPGKTMGIVKDFFRSVRRLLKSRTGAATGGAAATGILLKFKNLFAKSHKMPGKILQGVINIAKNVKHPIAMALVAVAAAGVAYKKEIEDFLAGIAKEIKGDEDSAESKKGEDKKGAEPTDNDVDALMRMLKAETSWTRSTPEMSAIIQVAINRKAAKGRKDFLSVVAPRTSGWNNASKPYARNFNNAHNYYGTPRAKKARQLIVDILKNGSSTGDLGGAQNWLHPHGMPKTDRPSKEIWTVTRPSGKKSTYISHDFGGRLGKRQLPLWAVHVSDGGSSKSMPTFVGSMLFSKGGGRSSKPSTTAVIIKSNKGDASNVIGIGDSITAGRNSWIDQIGGKKLAHENWSSTKIRNDIFDKHIITKAGKVVNKPKTLVIFAGVNNQGDPTRVIKDLNYMARKAQEKGIDVKLVKLLPSASWWEDGQRAPALKNIEKINNWISNGQWKITDGSGAVETASMSDIKGVLRNSKDGLHPNRKGQQELASLIGDAIKA